MFLTGFADEADPALAGQIEVTRELGWKFIEMRNVSGKMLGTMSDAEFAAVEEALAAAGLSVNCYGSGIANWSCHPRSDADFEKSRTELLTAVPRLHKLGVKMVRGMSFKVPEDEPEGSEGLEKVAFGKVKELVKICADNGLVYGHENCQNIGGMSWKHTLRLLEAVDSPALTLIFDTGNPCFNYRRLGPRPWPLQSSWEFYRQVRDHISYVHIKDSTAIPREDCLPVTENKYQWPGEGNGDIRAIVKDLLARGYDGGFSMEPHLGAIFHDPKAGDDDAAKIVARHKMYVEYGRRFTQLLRDCGWKC